MRRAERHRREVVVVERARLDPARVDQLDAAVGEPALVGHIVSVGQRQGRPKTSIPLLESGRQMANAKNKARAKRVTGKAAAGYTHPDKSLLMRPEVGTQAQFRKKKPPVTYRFDS